MSKDISNFTKTCKWNINTTDNETPVTLLALTIVDLATSWIVITPLPNKGIETVTIAFGQQWLCKYPRPLQCIDENGTEFVDMEFQEMLASYGIQAVITTIANPQLTQLFNAYIKLLPTSFALQILSLMLQLQGSRLNKNFMQHNGQSIQLIIQLLRHCLHN